jgi:tellurite resistance protein TerC
MIAWIALAAAGAACLWVDARFFARGRTPTFREGVVWSIGWTVLSLLAALVVFAVAGGDDAVTYTTVYFVERALSLDNLFVLLLVLSYFSIPDAWRGRLLFWAVAAALAFRGAAIVGGVALLDRFQVITYVLGALLLVLAWRVLRGVDEGVEPDSTFVVRAVRRFFPVAADPDEPRWFVWIDGRRHVTPMLLCLAAIVAADLAFAVDSIPAAFAITRNSVLIWMGNVFALLGLRALFVLVEGLIRRFRYLDQTIAAVLALVALKLLLEDVLTVGPLASLGAVALVLAVGIGASVLAERRVEA